jgi:phosphoglycolate phosphatase
MYQYILFDLDGTLTDPREGITKSVQYALREMGIDEPNLSALEHFIGPPLRSEFAESYGMDAQTAEQAVKAYRVRFSEIGWRENLLFDGVPDMLRKLKTAGKIIGIASSKPRIYVERILQHFEIADDFDVIVGSELDGTRDTKAEVVREALRQLGVTKENRAQAVLVGDRFHDIEGAHAEGIACIGVTFGFGGRAELEAYKAEWIVESIAELTALLVADVSENT